MYTAPYTFVQRSLVLCAARTLQLDHMRLGNVSEMPDHMNCRLVLCGSSFASVCVPVIDPFRERLDFFAYSVRHCAQGLEWIARSRSIRCARIAEERWLSAICLEAKV